MKNSIQQIARTGGILYLVIIITGLFDQLFIKNVIVVSADAAATATNISSHTSLWRIGIAGDMVMHICDIGMMVVFYLMFRPVSKGLALLAVLFNLTQTAVMVATKLNLFAPLFLLGNNGYLGAFEQSQLSALAYVAIRMDNYGFGIGLLFFGVECIILGYLIRKSGFLPKAIGILMQIAGICYLTNSFALILAPAFADRIFPAIVLPSFIGEVSFCLWLLIKGVNVHKWAEQSALVPA